MALKCSSAVKQKLAEKHGVSLEEVQQCFANREGGFHLQEWRHTAENLLCPNPKEEAIYAK
jgi:uncharacterized DUF497 family protein